MSTERSDRVYEYWLQASTKFDYFVAGVCIALVGYVGPQLEVAAFGLTSSDGLMALAVLTLLGAAVAGFKRIEAQGTVLKVMHRHIYSQEMRGSLTSAASSGRVMLNKATGEVMSPQEAWERALFQKVGVEVTEGLLDAHIKSASRWYALRNALLGIGLVCLIGSRIVPAYLG